MKNKVLKSLYETSLKIGFCLCLVLSGTTFASAQDSTAVKDNKPVAIPDGFIKVTGTVLEAANKTPMAGVRVEALSNRRYTTMTKEDGTFSLNVPTYVNTLYVSAPGYNGVQTAFKGKDYIEVKLYEDAFSANYENATHITAQGKVAVGITTSQTAENEIGNRLGADVRTITRSGTPDMGAMMLIRGLNSINATVQPLVVIDGVLTDLQEDYATVHSGYFNNVLSALDINDIDKIQVLKNATALYGAKGANGVILIDTRRGKSMATRITANVYGSYTLQPKLPDMMDASQYRVYANEMLGTLTTTKTRFPFLNDDPTYYYYNMYHNNTDWSDCVYREAFAQNYKVNVEGGDNVAMYNFSLGYTKNESTLEKNDFNRLNVRFNSDITLIDNLTTRFDISYSRTTRDLRDDGAPEEYVSGPISSPSFLALIKAPFLSPYEYNNDGTLTSSISEADNFSYGLSSTENYSNSSYYNPLTILQTGEGVNKNTQEYTQFAVSAAPKFVYKDWTFTSLFNYTLHRMNEKYYRPYGTSNSNYYFQIKGLGRSGNEVRSFFAKENVINSDTRIDWKKQLGAHYLNLFGGFRFTDFSYDSNYQSCHNTGNDKAPDISSSYDYLTDGGDNNIWRNFTYYLNADYNYQGKYFLQGIVTMDASSRFGKEASDGLKLFGIRWGVFPSLQAGWLISSEKWFTPKFVNHLKLRGGYDITGNDDIDYYACRSYFETQQYQRKAMTLQLGNAENQSVQWETTGRADIGLDAMLFNNRLGISFDYYYAKTTNLLVQKTYQYVAGLDTYWSNGGELKNQGFEVSVNAKLIAAKNWKLEAGFSAAHYKNEVTQLDEALSPVTVYGGQVLTQVGSPVGVFYGYETNGIFTTAKEASAANLYQLSSTGAKEFFSAGDVHYVDIKQDGVIDENDKTVIGDPNPDYYGNIFATLTYKNLSLNLTLNYSYGNDVYNYLRQQIEQGSNFFNQTTSLVNRWTHDGQQTDIPRIVYGDPMGNSRFSDRWIEDGSYLRLKQVMLSYKVPVPSSWNWLQGLTVWGSANNLLTFTKYLGSDPEFSASNNVLYQGVDAGLLSQSRSFYVGLKINL